MKKLTAIFLLIAAIFAFPTISLSLAQADAPEYIRIGLTRVFANREAIPIGNTRITAGVSRAGNFHPLANLQSESGFTARVTVGQVALYSQNQQVFIFTGEGAQIMDESGDIVRLGSYSYRGAIEFRPDGSSLTAINVLCIEEYLYGVLPVEMSYYFHINALKAQAIASRTFMTYRRNEGRHRGRGFDLCDDIHCQSYRGTGQEHENTTHAIRETAGQMLFYNNRVILAVYHASSGGSTDSSENVWVEARPYLRAVYCFAEHSPAEWSRTFTWEQITTALQSIGANIGNATGISITNTNQYGRVQEITIYGTDGQWVLRGEATRTFFAPIGGNLMSRNFYIEGAEPITPDVAVTDGHTTITTRLSSLMWKNAPGTIGPALTAYVYDGETLRRLAPTPTRATGGTGITINGRGWGHGVGMSQRGAHGMALAGFSYREILLHYYTGVEIR